MVFNSYYHMVYYQWYITIWVHITIWYMCQTERSPFFSINKTLESLVFDLRKVIFDQFMPRNLSLLNRNCHFWIKLNKVFLNIFGAVWMLLSGFSVKSRYLTLKKSFLTNLSLKIYHFCIKNFWSQYFRPRKW